MSQISVWRGQARETEVSVPHRWVTPEIAEIPCIECGGTGIWDGHPEIAEIPCVECKGTGRVLVS